MATLYQEFRECDVYLLADVEVALARQLEGQLPLAEKGPALLQSREPGDEPPTIWDLPTRVEKHHQVSLAVAASDSVA